MTAPVFPPLLHGEASGDPHETACARATQGCDAGLVVYDLGANTLRAAIVFAPELPLGDAMAMLPLCAIAFQNALGALAPPEIAVHLDWTGGVRLNGASCGGFRASASSTDPAAIPDWLVISFTLPLWPAGDPATGAEPGATPDQTTLFGEGCTDLDPVLLLEAWARHSLVWLNRWEDEGNAPLHREWVGLGPQKEAQITAGGQTGSYVGLDERMGLLLQQGGKTALIPLTELLETG